MTTKTELHPERLYDAKAVAEYLGIQRDTVYKISDRHLKRTRIGPSRGRTKFRGRDVIAYIDRMQS